MGVIETLLVTTAIAGIAGTGLGGLIGAMLQKDSNRTVSLLLSFAGGVMLSVVCFDLITEAIATNVGLFVVIAAIAFGVTVIYLLNDWIDRKTNPEVPHIDANHPKTADDLDELIHSDHYQHHHSNKDNKFALFVAGVVMACAIALHNLPEGMTIGASYASNNGVMGSSALVLAILIGLHNIPEGMAVSVPLISGGMGKSKAVLLVHHVAVEPDAQIGFALLGRNADDAVGIPGGEKALPLSQLDHRIQHGTRTRPERCAGFRRTSDTSDADQVDGILRQSLSGLLDLLINLLQQRIIHGNPPRSGR